ncbi:DUF4254 domain-containing protein [Nocardia pseudovaccinii]|uniref:DUF4254 domain-containing protein n=1 Tax=Nocardia pseudovaccinii TaxID=189540 RepID=UPI0007A377E0|nr:DUF4254 domain-containing protein [Nocardia pseudovaccinii]
MRAIASPDTTAAVSDGSQPGPVALFLSGEALLSAIRGHHVGVHPLAKLAHDFGVMYQRRLTFGSECCCRRDELVLAVDVWVADHLPVPHPAATMHTETLGAVIARLAEAQVHAYHLLMTIDPADPVVHTAWYRLAELVDGYTDLTTDVARRARRLPVLGDHW